MLRSGTGRPSAALIVAFVALLVALGGTSYATFAVPPNSVGTPQLKNDAVTTGKIANGAVTASKINPNGLTVPNASHASSARSATNSSELGGVAASSYQRYGATLPSGQTESGDWGFGGNATAGGQAFYSAYTFRFPLAAALEGDHVVYVSGASATHCSGQGSADPGYLCVYQSSSGNASSSSVAISNTEAGGNGADKNGFVLIALSSASGQWMLQGTYSVTAP